MLIRRDGLRHAIRAHVESHDVTRVIYGTVIGLALVVALDAHPPGPGEAAALILSTAVAVTLAEIYSELVGRRGADPHAHHAARLRAVSLAALGVLFGAGFPAVFFVLAALGAIQSDLAFTLSKWTGLGLICAYGYIAGRMSGSAVPAALVHSAAVGAIGGTLIGLKALLH